MLICKNLSFFFVVSPFILSVFLFPLSCPYPLFLKIFIIVLFLIFISLSSSLFFFMKFSRLLLTLLLFPSILCFRLSFSALLWTISFSLPFHFHLAFILCLFSCSLLYIPFSFLNSYYIFLT